MDRDKEMLKTYIMYNHEIEVLDMLTRGLDPNYEGGWPIRLAARNGHCSLVKILIEHGASPHLLSEAGASTLQLAVYSGLNWDTDDWKFLLSCCDSSQLADAAAVAIIFNNTEAIEKILKTGRCNVHIPTSLTRKTVDELARGYNLRYLLNTNSEILHPEVVSQSRSRESLRSQQVVRSPHRNLSPSVAHFFDLTARQTSLTPPHSPLQMMFTPQSQQ